MKNKAIEEKAYHLWQSAGEPEGRSEEFYFAAQREVQVNDFYQFLIPQLGFPCDDDIIVIDFTGAIFTDRDAWNQEPHNWEKEGF